MARVPKVTVRAPRASRWADRGSIPRGAPVSVGSAATARLSSLAAGIPGRAFLAEVKSPALFVVTPVGVFLESAAALARHRAVGHRQGRRLRGQDSDAFQSGCGAAAIGRRRDRDGRVLFTLCQGAKKRGGRSRPPFPSGTLPSSISSDSPPFDRITATAQNANRRLTRLWPQGSVTAVIPSIEATPQTPLPVTGQRTCLVTRQSSHCGETRGFATPPRSGCAISAGCLVGRYPNIASPSGDNASHNNSGQQSRSLMVFQ